VGSKKSRIHKNECVNCERLLAAGVVAPLGLEPRTTRLWEQKLAWR